MDTEKILQQLGGMQQHLVNIDEGVGRMEANIKDINIILTVGNGKPSVLSRLVSLESKAESKAAHSILTWSAIIAVAAAAVGGFVQARSEIHETQSSITESVRVEAQKAAVVVQSAAIQAALVQAADVIKAAEIVKATATIKATELKGNNANH